MKKAFFNIFLISFIFVLLITSWSYAKIPEIILEQKKAVVTIYIYDGDKQIASGSGCIIDGKGILATNYHVIATTLNASNASVVIKMTNGEIVNAEKIIAVDKDYDLVLIKLKENNLPFLRLSKNYKPKQGDDVVVIGSPFGLETTVSDGIISSIRGKDEFIQITAPISPGSSGSPVFNSEGEVIGIATLLIEGGQNLNFAIPVKYITTLLANPKTPEEEAPKPIKAPAPVPEEAPAPEPIDFIPDKAIEEISLAIVLTPNDASLYSKRAEYLSSNNSDLEAIRDLTKAISLDPRNGFYYFQRYLSYIGLEQNELALNDITKAIELKKNSPDLDSHNELFSNRGWLYIVMEKYDKAFEDYKRAIKIDPDAFLIYPSTITTTRDKFSDCVKFFNKMISLRPKDSFIYSDRADFYTELKQYDKALNDISKAIELAPTRNYNYYFRGKLYILKGDQKKAKSDFQKVCYSENNPPYFKQFVELTCNRLAEIEQDEARGEKWKRFSSTETASLFYDTTSIKPFKKHLRVWLRVENDVNAYMEELKGNNIPIAGYEDYSHGLFLWELDCSSEQIGKVSAIDYSKTGNVLNSQTTDSINMKPVIPDSVGATLLKIVCGQKKKAKGHE